MRTAKMISIVAICLAALCFAAAAALEINAAINRNGAWSLTRSNAAPIEMNMHGTLVYLSQDQKLIYYDGSGYCLWAAFALCLVARISDGIGAGRNDGLTKS